MNEQEWMFNKLSQELIEVAKEISKVLEFGLLDHNPDYFPIVTNQSRVEHELNDLFGVLDKMIDDGYLNKANIFCDAGRNNKRIKIRKWMKHAKEMGALK